MCGRYSLFVSPADLEERFDVTVTEYQPTYNAAPGQQLPVIRDVSAETLHHLEWGLIPPWAKSRDDSGHINARAETLGEKASFRDAFVQSRGDLSAGRCLVLADGFYEWTEKNGGKQPFRITRADEEPFAMAGLWTQWRPQTTQTGLDEFSGSGTGKRDELVETFTIVTTEPNELMADLHHRMPAVLPMTQEREWLTRPTVKARELLDPVSSEELRAYPVSTAVNNPANDVPEVTEAVE